MKKFILTIPGILLSVFGGGMFICCLFGAIEDEFQPIHVYLSLFFFVFIANAAALYTGRIACLHLFPHNPILVAELVVRTVVKFILQKTCHLILIEIHLAGVALIILIIHKIAARLTACGHLAGVLFLLCMGCWFCHMAIPPIFYTILRYFTVLFHFSKKTREAA